MLRARTRQCSGARRPSRRSPASTTAPSCTSCSSTSSATERASRQAAHVDGGSGGILGVEQGTAIRIADAGTAEAEVADHGRQVVAEVVGQRGGASADALDAARLQQHRLAVEPLAFGARPLTAVAEHDHGPGDGAIVAAERRRAVVDRHARAVAARELGAGDQVRHRIGAHRGRRDAGERTVREAVDERQCTLHHLPARVGRGAAPRTRWPAGFR